MTICICFIFTKLYFKCIFQEILSSAETACRTRAFDLILNLGVHAQLLEPMIVNDASTIEEEYSQESYYDSNTQVMVQESRKGSSQNKSDTVSAIDNFESWIINILYEILLLLVQVSSLGRKRYCWTRFLLVFCYDFFRWDHLIDRCHHFFTTFHNMRIRAICDMMSKEAGIPLYFWMTMDWE